MSIEKSNSTQNWVKWLLIIPVLFAVSAVVSYSVTFKHLPHNQDPGAWGTFGDYFGGLLNPVIAGCTLFVAVRVWQLQKIELKATQEALQEQAKTAEQQRGEQRFFDLLNIYLRTIDAITWNSTEGREHVKGRDAIRQWSQDRLEHRGHFAICVFLKDGLLSSCSPQIENYPQKNWPRKEDVQKNFANEVSFLYPYLRTVFRLLSDAELLFKDPTDLYRYIKLFRAQLSDEELQALALNLWLTDVGAKMRPIANKYGLLKHLPEGALRTCVSEELGHDFPQLFGKVAAAPDAA